MGDVRIMSRRMVRPETTALPPVETIHLTPWDLKSITVEHIQKGVLLPKPPTTGGHVDVERLASSFGRALGRFYPYAGRLDAAVVPASNDGASPQCQSLTISLRCGGEGAEFIHAVAPSVTVADITASLLVPRAVWSFFPLDGLLGADAIEGSLPLLAAQVTELADSVFIAVSMNHSVADGMTFWQFFNTWSELSRAGGNDDVMISTPLPVFDRSFLGSFTVPIPLPFGKLEDVVGQRVHLFPSVQECFLHFSAASVKNLKTKANDEMSGYGITSTISSLQALLAHLWRAVCRARRLAPDQETTYTVLVGCRGRVGGIPASYAGNTVEHATAKSTARDILDKGLGWAAWLLNEAVASFDTAYASDKLASWPQEPRFMRLPELVAATPTWTVTGSSPRFDVYGNDFGWGAPVTVRSGAGNKIDGKATVYKGRGCGGSIALEVCLAPQALARLVADEEFMEVRLPRRLPMKVAARLSVASSLGEGPRTPGRRPRTARRRYLRGRWRARDEADGLLGSLGSEEPAGGGRGVGFFHSRSEGVCLDGVLLCGGKVVVVPWWLCA
uniref:HCBT-like putative defense response protein n=2 Tax=Aegilops tauschii TaxID=37682 RepID=Q8LLA0_AEGTA|nr:HCBT-like putative defense response protein [Aegilops tauschii]